MAPWRTPTPPAAGPTIKPGTSDGRFQGNNAMSKGLFIVKPVEPAGHVDAGEPVEGSLQGETSLKRTLTARQLVMLGIGAVIGAGIFVLSGHAAAEPLAVALPRLLHRREQGGQLDAAVPVGLPR